MSDFNLAPNSNSIFVRLYNEKTDSIGAHANNTRGIKLWWKETIDKVTKIANPKIPSVFAVIPNITCSIEPAILQETVINYLHSLQEAYIREEVEQHYEAHNNTFTTMMLSPKSLEASSIVAWSRSTASGDKINAAAIRAYCEMELAPLLLIKLANQVFGTTDIDALTSDQLGQAEINIAMYIDGLTKLAAPVPAMSPATARELHKAVVLLPDASDRVPSFLLRKLETVLAKAQETSALIGLL